MTSVENPLDLFLFEHEVLRLLLMGTEQSTGRTGQFQQAMAEDGGVGQRPVNDGAGAHPSPRALSTKDARQSSEGYSTKVDLS